MKIKCFKIECQVCNKLASTQVFYNGSGEVKYARAKHYMGRVDCKPQFEYHQQSLEYVKRKLNQIPKSLNQQIVCQVGQVNDDLEKLESSTISKSEWVVSSARIERQPSKLEVKGSNPLRPAFSTSFNQKFLNVQKRLFFKNKLI